MNGDQVLLNAFAREHPARVARAVGADGALLVAMADDAAALVVRQMSPMDAARALTASGRAAPTLGLLPPRLAAAILRNMDSAEAVLREMAPRARSDTRALLRYLPDTVGAVMSADVFSISDTYTAGEALTRANEEAARALYYVYVVDSESHVVGAITLRELMLAPGTTSVRDIMHADVAVISAGATTTEGLNHPAWDRLRALPVVDHDVFVGAIRYRTLVDVTQAGGPHEGAAAALGELFGLGLLAIGGALGSVAWRRDR